MKTYALTSTTPGKTIDMLEDMDISLSKITNRLKMRLDQAGADGWSAIKEYRLVSKTSDENKYHQWTVLDVYKWSKKTSEFI